MALRMAKLERDPKTGNWRSRKVIPVDCRHVFGKREDKPTWPSHLTEADARQRFGIWLADVEGRIASIREQAKRQPRTALSEFDIERLARIWKAYLLHEDEARRMEGLTERDYRKMAETFSIVELGLGEELARGDISGIAFEARDFLSSQGFEIDEDSADFRKFAFRFLKEWRAVIDLKKARHAGQVVETPPMPEEGARITVMDMFDRYEEAKKSRIAEVTMRGYRRKLASFAAFVGDRDIRSLCEDDVYAWAKHRESVDNVKPHIVQKNDVAAVSSVFGWAASALGGRIVKANIAADIDLQAPEPEVGREPTFTQAEVKRILSAARRAAGDNTTHEHRRNARRWCPWLCAYSGARIGEITQLRREDFWEEDGHWFYRITPLAGSTKTRKSRLVPLHEHLVAEGFLLFLKSVPSGPLFYDPTRRKKADAVTSLAALEAQKLATWLVQAADLTDDDVQVNHAWRHTWKTEALGVGIDERIRDQIAGHSTGRTARKYEHPNRFLAEAMARFPRYRVDVH